MWAPWHYPCQRTRKMPEYHVWVLKKKWEKFWWVGGRALWWDLTLLSFSERIWLFPRFSWRAATLVLMRMLMRRMAIGDADDGGDCNEKEHYSIVYTATASKRKKSTKTNLFQDFWDKRHPQRQTDWRTIPCTMTMTKSNQTFLCPISFAILSMFIACCWDDIQLIKRRAEGEVWWHERPLFDLGLPVGIVGYGMVFHVQLCHVVRYDIVQLCRLVWYCMVLCGISSIVWYGMACKAAIWSRAARCWNASKGSPAAHQSWNFSIGGRLSGLPRVGQIPVEL